MTMTVQVLLSHEGFQTFSLPDDVAYPISLDCLAFEVWWRMRDEEPND